MISGLQPRMHFVTTRHPEITMNHPIAATWKPQVTSIALPGRRLGDKIRFVAGVVITLGGAGVLLSDMMHLIASLG